MIQMDEGELNYNCDPRRLLLCRVAEGKTDIYFWDDQYTDGFLTSFALMDLREILPQELLEKYEDQLIYNTAILQGGYPCAISLKENLWIKQNNYYGECTVGVARTADNLGLVYDFLRYIL